MAAIVLIHAILVHRYIVFWVKGSIQGMIEGKVSYEWTKKHHSHWYRLIIAKEQARQTQTNKIGSGL